MYLISAVKYRPHRPHRRKYCNFQGFRAGGTFTGIDRHDKYRPRIARLVIVEFCRSFILYTVHAVGAIDTFPSIASGS
jgi:hypothetical protein